MKIDNGFYVPGTPASDTTAAVPATGPETLICTPPFGRANWAAKAGYIRLKSMGDVQLQVWIYRGSTAGWDNKGLVTLTRNGPCVSFPIVAASPDGGSVAIWRIKKTSDDEASVPVDACVEII